jgi:LysR family transcriptional activator of nhaA
MNPWINYHHLFYFKTIAEEGGVSKAAKKLRLGQPTLSAQLKSFENQLDVKLFTRTGRDLILTEQGKVVLDYAKSIFDTGLEMVEVLRDGGKQAKPHFHIGTIDSVPKQITADLVNCALEVSNCRITLSEGGLGTLLVELKAFRMDLILTNSLPAGVEAKGVHSRSVYREKVSVFAAPAFKKLRKGFPRSMSAQPFIIPTYDSHLRQDLESWMHRQEVRPDVVIESQDIAIKKMLAINGVGLIPATPASVAHQVRQGELIEIGPLEGVIEEFFVLKADRKIENPVGKLVFKQFYVSL